MVDTVDKEYKGGYLDAESAIKELYPDLDDHEVEERAMDLDRINNRTSIETTVDDTAMEDNQDGMDQNRDQTSETV